MLGVPVMRSVICSTDTPVEFDGVTRTAIEWAEARKIKWQTVKMRRYRGASWAEALRQGRIHNRWLSNMGAFAAERQQESAEEEVAGAI